MSRKYLNSGDWTAFAGGKGWYGSYDPGEANPDQLIKISAHHGDFAYMLWKMEHGEGHLTNNEFGISELGRNHDLGVHRNTERGRANVHADFGINAW